jgi:hypothetical protein
MTKKQKSPHPEWAIKHRIAGTELRLIRGKYYLYAVSSKYDPALKRAKKISGKLLGTITEENGFKESAKRILIEQASKAVDLSRICVRENGFTSFLQQYNKTIEEKLKQYFPDLYQNIMYMAFARLVHNSALRDMAFHVAKSMMSLKDKVTYTEKHFSTTLRTLGSMRLEAVDYMKSFFKQNDYVLVDMTNMFNASENIRLAKEGYNSDMIFDKQFNLMYLYSPVLVQPVFYRLFSGNIKEIRGFKLCLQESGINNLQHENLNYIIPLKRENRLIEHGKLQRKNLSYFKFEGRYIWHITYVSNNQRIYLYKDEKLKVQEERDYLDRIETLPEYYQIESFHEREERFGTIALLSNVEGKEAEHIYTTYKSRNEVEVMFDGMKNILHTDRTYMQNEDALQGWMFINHIALQWYYIIYSLLKQNNQLKRYSVRQFITHLNEIKKVRINDDWVMEPITRDSANMLEKLHIHIT